ncbi:PREDICTED: metal tolerance protein 9-like isoform X1 [Ipomoea nil]|uniref:metal tolerance protein 9-like isoform X1 n=2 Tax=Ipomoea nil TaxID=35883 RepID=UPI000901FE86|nr:PREDICTED: metal tolerance protein 9-like isoform X1 [Ipomoea nil]
MCFGVFFLVTKKKDCVCFAPPRKKKAITVADYRMELLSPAATPVAAGDSEILTRVPSWRLNFNEHRLPQRRADAHSGFGTILQSLRRQRKIRQYYKRQEELLKGFNEVDEFLELGYLPGALSEGEMKQADRREKIAIHASNIANFVLFVAKVYASVESRSLAVIASTLDSLLDLLSGFILWFTAHSMSKPNQYRYPIGKQRMQPVGIVVFASVMATLGLQILFESGRQLIMGTHPEKDAEKEMWMIGIMVSVTIIKFILMLYCRQFKNEIIKAYAQDHFFDVITNSVGLGTAVLAIHFFWWIDPVGAIIIALYTMSTWARTVMENVGSLIGRTAPAEYLSKLVYLAWNHHEDIKHIATARAYNFGSGRYFVEMDIVLPGETTLNRAHNIGESLEEKIEQLPEVERAFVHADFEAVHQPEHSQKKTNNK